MDREIKEMENDPFETTVVKIKKDLVLASLAKISNLGAYVHVGEGAGLA